MPERFSHPDAIQPRPVPWVGTHPGLQWQVCCPTCGEQGLDRADWGPDHEAVTVHPDRDDYDSPLGTRGGYIRIELRCSSGHRLALIVANHKGTEVIGLIPSGEQS